MGPRSFAWWVIAFAFACGFAPAGARAAKVYFVDFNFEPSPDGTVRELQPEPRQR